MLISEKKINKAVEKVLMKWLNKNNEVLLSNIRLTIKNWLESNKEEIFTIIKEEQT